MRWIKMWTEEIVKGPTFSELTARERGVWFSLLALAGVNGNGKIEVREGQGYSDNTLAEILNLEKAELKSGIEKLKAVDKIYVDEKEVIIIKNFSKYQNEYSRQKPYRRFTRKAQLQTQLQAEKEKEIKKDNIPLSAANQFNTASKKSKKSVPEGYGVIVEHICKSFENSKKSKYPFRNLDSSIIKQLLTLYDAPRIMALWDIFLRQDWNWKDNNTGKLVRIAHDLRQFQAKITVLLDDHSYKPIAEKYAAELYDTPIQVPAKMKEIPQSAPDTTQEKKVEAYKHLQSIAKE